MGQDQADETPAPIYDVEFEHVTKEFTGATAVRDLSFRVARGSFFSLLGPSGCGKTTTLRLIAGFEQPNAGRIAIGGADVAGLPPYRRDCNTVFQSYSLFPHMTVAENIAYGLRQKRMSRDEIDRRVREALVMVRLPGADRRRPAQLSGGQQQRVALARALVNRPTVLLLDEPLSALDLKLRKEMQSELKALQRAVGITFIYVTHDQEEAITLSDRIAVMHAGRIEQEGGPEEIYDRPLTRFVADFIGLTNFIEGTVREPHLVDGAGVGVVVRTAIGDITCGGYQPAVAAGDAVTLTLRPEKIQALPSFEYPPTGWNGGAGTITQATFLGPQTEYLVSTGDVDSERHTTLTVRQQNTSGSPATQGGAERMRSDDAQRRLFGPGERVTLAWRREASLILRDASAVTRESEGESASTQTPQSSHV